METDKWHRLFKMTSKYITYLIIAAGMLSFLLVFINTNGNYSGKIPTSKLGTMNLENWNFNENGAVRLNGEWEFYYEKLLNYEDFHNSKNSKNTEMSGYIKMPGKWKSFKLKDEKINATSYGTYRLIVKLSKAVVNETFGIHVPYPFTSYKLIMNDKQIASATNHSDRNTAIIKNKNIFFRPENNSLEIIIQVTSQVFAEGGTHLPIYLGLYDNIVSKEKSDLLKEMMFFTCLIVMGLYHVLLYNILKKMKFILYFGLFCVGVALRSSIVNEAMLMGQFMTINFGIYEFFNLSMGLICLAFFGGFIYELYPLEFSKKFYKGIWVFCIFMSISCIVLPYSVYSQMVTLDNLMLVLCAIYYLYVIIRASFKKREGYKVMIFAILIMVVTSVSDVIVISNKNDTTRYGMMPLGTIICVFALAILLSKIYANAFISVDSLSKQLLSLDKLKDEFLANTSHELRTPLNGIIGLAESLVDGAAGETSDEVKKNLSIISASGKRLSNLVNDILDYSKLKNSDIKLVSKPLDFYELVDLIMVVFEMTKHNDHVIIKNEIPIDLPYIYADEARLQQIMYNLLGNAVKFTEEGEISVSAKVMPDFIEITVKDTGIGVPKEKLEDIFKSFEQIDMSGQGNYNGTGLGLTVSKRLVELHGGSIRCESSLGLGSSFIFTLPAFLNPSLSKRNHYYNKANNERREDKRLSFHPVLTKPNMDEVNYKAKILVVDDEPVNLQVLMNQLSLENYNVVTATNGQTALKLIEEIDFDLIVLDAMMPKISGYQVCKKIRENYTLIDLPILMLTANDQLSNICLAFECGTNDYVTKPFEKQELIARIKTLVTMKKAVKQSIRDPLTGSYNKRHMFELGELIFEEHRKENKPMSVIMMDIDNFKAVNDTFGHPEGDNILIEIASECKKTIRATDIFGRYGGEEFFVILPNIEIEDTVKLAERIRENISNKSVLTEEGKEMRVTMSLGVATSNSSVINIEQLLKEADKAMYQAKANGKNRVEISNKE